LTLSGLQRTAGTDTHNTEPITIRSEVDVSRFRDVALAPYPDARDLARDPLSAKCIKDARAYLDTTAGELADLLGVKERTVRSWEHNRNRVGTDENNGRNCSGPARLLLIKLLEEAKHEHKNA